jgi:uncharacterized membrane protein
MNWWYKPLVRSMKERTKLRLKFYGSIVGLVAYTLLIGAFFQFLEWYGWHMRLERPGFKYDMYITMAIILYVMFIVDIVLFFRLIIQKRYW